MKRQTEPLKDTPEKGITPYEAQQIASVLSGGLKVKIKEGNEWLYNYLDKTIYYRKEDLFSLRQLDVVANLLHEAGHAKYSTNPSKLKDGSKVPKEKENHRKGLKELLNMIEDFRIEDKLRMEYPYAKDYLPLYSFKTAFILNLLSQRFIDFGEKVPRIIVYCHAIYAQLAKVPFKIKDKQIIKKVKLTTQSALKARKTKNTDEVLKIIVNEIYPHIKDLLDEYKPLSSQPMVAFSSSSSSSVPIYNDLYPSIKHLIKPTTNRFNRLLTDTKFDKLAGKFRTGKQLDKRRLYKFRLGETRLFQRKIEASTKDYVVSLVIDESGSMTDDFKNKNEIGRAH